VVQNGSVRRMFQLGACMAYAVVFASWLAAQQADVVLHHGKILTVDDRFSIAEAIAVTGNKITAVGTNEDVLKQAGPSTTSVDLKGRTVIPGLIDTHLHITGPGPYLGELQIPDSERRDFIVDWRGVKDKQDVLNQMKQLMDKYKPPAGEWIAFDNQLSFANIRPDEEEPVAKAKILYDDMTRYDLDKIAPDNPIVLTMGIPDENGLFVNSKGIDVLWSKHGDFIKKYGRFWVGTNGQPDGHLEPPATRLLLNLYAPRLRADQLAPGLKKMLQELNAQGHTTISTKLRTNSIDAYQSLEKRSELTMRMAYGLGWDFFGSFTDPAKDLKKYQNQMGVGSDWTWINSFAPSSFDGASTRACTNQKRSGGAFGPIDDWFKVGQCHTDSEYKGGPARSANIAGNYFQDWVLTMGAYNLRLANDHVAGDRSVANLLGMIERIQKQYGPNATKNWGFDHCTLVDPKDLPRAARLGVMFSCAPKYIQDVAPAAAVSYGPQVANTFVVPVKSMLNAGVRVVYEADRDTYVWDDLELFLTRKSIDGKVYGPQEKLDKQATLRTVTRWAADYVLRPDTIGSLETGKLADLVILDRDYLTIPDEQVSEIKALMTMLDGKIIFEDPRFADEYNLHAAGATVSTFKELNARRPKRVVTMVGEGGG
jgi:predicted amidohydrolase YtcJ